MARQLLWSRPPAVPQAATDKSVNVANWHPDECVAASPTPRAHRRSSKADQFVVELERAALRVQEKHRRVLAGVRRHRAAVPIDEVRHRT